MDYDFSKLSTRTFEHLVQALAVRYLGPQVSVFGDGPDGGREANFERLAAYPSTDEPWDGYGVIQAKFRQRLTTTSVDGKWVLSELDKELKKFASSRRKLRKPRYYILATNVPLSAVADTGAKDKAAALLNSYRLKIGLREHALWDYDQLRTMLDDAADIRRAYGAWLTPGDVLGTLLDDLQQRQPDFKQTIVSFIQKELHSDELVRLGQAGATDRDSTPLANVFTDLPVEEPYTLDEDAESDEPNTPDESTLYAVRSLVEIGNDRLARSSTAPNARADRAQDGSLGGRLVFLGGPGQGKTTLSQFICQLHRATVLRELCVGQMLADTRKTVDSIIAQAELEGIAVPRMPRFPVRIVLNDFATELAGGHASSIMESLQKRITKRTQRNISCETLREWLSAYPWLVVLDGLDEVPGASNRNEVLAAVQDFLIDISDLNADVLLVCTTRPQGYNEDFSPGNFSHQHLAPLSVAQALKYAQRLVNQRWGGDEDRVAVLMDRLRRASEEASTARLMRSPLQVTIMALLVESMGLPPRERWRLFREYFQVITRREKERPLPSAALLNLIEPDINFIHKAVGFQLQRISERSGHTDATLSEEEFATIVSQRLELEGHTGRAKETLAHDVTRAALERLVFLVSPQMGQIGFEIRSLQEFMAAEFLTDGSDESVITRLKAIAPAAHWRNVFLFATGRCFHERQHLRRPLHYMLCELNDTDALVGVLHRATLLGSQLALDILEDGSLLQQPEQLSLYKRLAIRLIEIPPSDEHDRLAEQYDDKHQEIFETALELATASSRHAGFVGGWRVLTQIADKGVSWAFDMVSHNWPASMEDVELVLRGLDRMRPAMVAERAVEFVLHSSPVLVAEVLVRGGRQKLIPSAAPAWLRQLLENDDSAWSESAELNGLSSSFTFSLSEVSDLDCEDEAEIAEDPLENVSDSVDRPTSDIHPAWLWLRHAAMLKERPAKATLATLIRDYKNIGDTPGAATIRPVSKNIPWPLAALVGAVRNGADAEELAAAVDDGRLGSGHDWVTAQRRWLKAGVTTDDLAAYMSTGLPFDSRIGELGFPLSPGGATLSHRGDLPEVLDQLVDIWIPLPSGAARAAIADQLLFVSSVIASTGGSFSEKFSGVFGEIVATTDRTWVYVEVLGGLPEAYWRSANAIEDVRRFGALRVVASRRTGGCHEFLPIERLFAEYPSDLAVARCLAAAISCGYKPKLAPDVRRYLTATANSEALPHYTIIFLATSPNDLDFDLIGATAVRAAKLDSDVFVDQLCSLVAPGGQTGPLIEKVLSDVYRATPPCDSEGRRKLMRTMLELQRRQVSAVNS